MVTALMSIDVDVAILANFCPLMIGKKISSLIKFSER